ncbi:Protein BOBBER 1 [Diplonema papillatum]|nr:Protein BOBBER 1 [Diplonema papillatum]
MLTSKHGRCRWSQTDEEVEARIQIARGTKSRDVNFKLKDKHVTAGLSEQEHLVDVELCHAVVPSDSHWQLEDEGEGRVLVLTLKKARAGVTWRAFLLADNPKPAPSTTTKDYAKVDKGDDEAPKSEPSKRPPLFYTIEPGTLAAIVMLVTSVCVGILKSYFK